MPDIHHLVERYLGHFDAASSALPEPRRTALREEIANHLSELVPAGTHDDDARLALLEFGGPEEILGQEAGAPVARATRPKIIGVVAVGVTIVAVVASIWLGVAAPDEQSASPSPSGSHSEPALVRSDPTGPERVTSGPAFDDYATEAGELPPLPEGASWPSGVPVGADAGLVPDASGVLQAGAGVVIANFTYACAWKIEYIEASSAQVRERAEAAVIALTEWSDYFWAPIDQEHSWAVAVLDGDPHSIRSDVATTCMQAGIHDVHNVLRERGL